MTDLDKLAEHYQRTGEVLPEYYLHQNTYLLKNIQKFYDEYLEKYSELNYEFSLYVYEQMHEWDVKNGFFKEYNSSSLTAEELAELEEYLDEDDMILFEAFFDLEEDDDDSENH